MATYQDKLPANSGQIESLADPKSAAVLSNYHNRGLNQLVLNFLKLFMTGVGYLQVTSTRNKSAIDHFPTNFNIYPTKVHRNRPNLLYIFNGMAINNLQMSCFLKSGQPISNPYF